MFGAARLLLLSLLLLCAAAPALTGAQGQGIPYALRIEIDAPADAVHPAGIHTDHVTITMTCTGLLTHQEPLEVRTLHEVDGAYWESEPDRTITFDAQDCLHERPKRYTLNVTLHLVDEGGAVHPVALRVTTDRSMQAEAGWNHTTETVTGSVALWTVHHPWLPSPHDAGTVRFDIILHNPNNNAVETRLEAIPLPGAELEADWPDSLGPSETHVVRAEYTPGNATGWCCPGDHVFHNVTIRLTYTHPAFDAWRTDDMTFPLFFEREPTGTHSDATFETEEAYGPPVGSLVLALGLSAVAPRFQRGRRDMLQ